MLEKILAKLKNTPSIPGFAASCTKEGKVITETYEGFANLEYDHEVTPTTAFNIGSIAKQFTAAAVVTLVRQGKLNYEDKLNKFLHVPKWASGITMTHLMQHTSGIKDWPKFDLNNDATYGRFLQMKELSFEPGSKLLYSNTGYVLLAMAVERVADISFSKYLGKNIFEPCDMHNTFMMEGNASVIPQRAYGYRQSEGIFHGYEQSGWEVGDGGVYTTIRDLQSWDRVLHTDSLLSNQEIATMQTSGILKNGKKTNYGFGLCIGSSKNDGIFYHSGGDAGFVAFMARKPATRSSIILMTNSGNLNEDEKKWARLKNSLLGIMRTI